MPEYKVFEVQDAAGEKKYQIFWCPSAPMHYTDRVPYTDRLYPQRQGAYRKCRQLNAGTAREQRRNREEVLA